MGYEDVRFPEGSLFLVTGGAGFIGSNLCEAILKLGYRVRCLDNLSTGKREHVELFSGNPCYTFIEGEIRTPVQRPVRASIMFCIRRHGDRFPGLWRCRCFIMRTA